MAIIEWPEEIQTKIELRCVVCNQAPPVIEMTIGLLLDSSRQGFACSEHLGRGDSARFLRAWVDFLLRQRNIAKQA